MAEYIKGLRCGLGIRRGQRALNAKDKQDPSQLIWPPVRGHLKQYLLRRWGFRP